MKMVFKLPTYVELEVSEETNRIIVTDTFNHDIIPIWGDFLSKLRFSPEERKMVEDHIGSKVRISFTPDPPLYKKK